ncbi:hypothetical protein GCM10017044_05810 [Kordiimonas sediminis]|uniref:DEAD/DEAH box helicase n=1 Tax=Kordiimonas sediminis TaxID=1735581 RepID=A0A919ANI9_9PROT|nr:DEAD/DEAH box helicase [Kordiimonas sediminis]GHF14548.1 hypothetical protein GCM10017044_05810 [Kordiimonas sediminis]
MTQTFSDLGLNDGLMRTLEEQGYSTPTPIQNKAIPFLMGGGDMIGVAQTGSGKTAAFVLPILNQLAKIDSKPKPGMPRALFLAPTRELAMQIGECVKDMARFLKLKQCTVFGGAPYKTQIHILNRGVDVLVATPGRLLDHIKQGNIYLDETSFFVLDEADRMLDMGFIDDVTKIGRKLISPHQSIMFSATFEPRIRQLAETLLDSPELIEIEQKQGVADNIDHRVLFTYKDEKKNLLLHMLEEINPGRSIIFVRTRRDADDVAWLLNKNKYKADAIHGDKNQRVRQRMINNFKAGKFDFLVATDVAARGIDVKDITHVFNMDVPVEAENYIHRVGRTARGGGEGTAFTFCDRGELHQLRTIERLIKSTIDVIEDHPFPMPEPVKKPRPKRRREADSRSRKRPSTGKVRRTSDAGLSRGAGPARSKPTRTRAKGDWDPTKVDTGDAVAPRTRQDAAEQEPQRDRRKPKAKRPGATSKPHRKGRSATAKPGKPGKPARKRSEKSAAGDRSQKPARAAKGGRGGKRKSNDGGGSPLTRAAR